ncbi:MAG: DUF4886 domain-containing protein [Verrucomicrobiales bacterium]
MTRRASLLFAVALMTLPAGAADVSRVLFVGNSYTGQVRATFLSMLKGTEAENIHFEFITPGGCTLGRHLENDKTVKTIEEGDWDLVILQEQSQTPGLPGKFGDSFQDSADKLCRMIRTAGAEPVFYMTWGRRDGDSRNSGIYPDYDAMQEKLTDAYEKAARRNKAEIAPVGIAWKKVRKEFPELGEKLYKADGSHPSALGACLVTSVFFQEVFGGDLKTMGAPKGVTDEEFGQILSVVLAHRQG